LLPEGEAYINKKVDALLNVLGQVLVNKAKRFCPVDTGRLRGSITYATSKEQSDTDSGATDNDKIKSPTEINVVRVGTAVEYAMAVEFGTKDRGNSPFLRPALLTTDLDSIKRKVGFK